MFRSKFTILFSLHLMNSEPEFSFLSSVTETWHVWYVRIKGHLKRKVVTVIPCSRVPSRKPTGQYSRSTSFELRPGQKLACWFSVSQCKSRGHTVNYATTSSFHVLSDSFFTITHSIDPENSELLHH